MIDTLIKRINELEIQSAHHQRMTEDLSTIITKQGIDVDNPNRTGYIFLPGIMAL